MEKETNLNRKMPRTWSGVIQGLSARHPCTRSLTWERDNWRRPSALPNLPAVTPSRLRGACAACSAGLAAGGGRHIITSSEYGGRASGFFFCFCGSAAKNMTMRVRCPSPAATSDRSGGGATL